MTLQPSMHGERHGASDESTLVRPRVAEILRAGHAGPALSMTVDAPLLQRARQLRARMASADAWDSADVLAGDAERLLRDAPPARLLAVDAELRRSAANIDATTAPFGLVALASMQRNGHVREAATRALRESRDPVAFRLLLVRCNDVVPSVAAAAEAGLLAWLSETHADAMTEALPLIDALGRTVRAAASASLSQLSHLLAAPSHAIDRALAAAVRTSHDERTRRLAIERLAKRDPPDETLTRILALCLGDADPRVRLASARLAASKRTPVQVRETLLPMLERDRAPSVRLVALRTRYQADPEQAARAIARATLDPNGNVRHHARMYLARSSHGFDTRAEALARLSQAEVTTLIGALAALSDVGLRADIAAIDPFSTHGNARVRREAARTLACLHILPD